MSSDFASITETPGTLLSPEQYARVLHRYAFGLRESGLVDGGARVLEVGCGAGSGLAAWHDTGGFVTGLEYVADSLQIARANLGDRVPLLRGDAQQLPFTHHSFDAITSFEVIYYHPDSAAFLHESRRILVPGGKLILCWSNPEWEAFAPGAYSVHYPTLAEMAALLEQTGFDDARFYGAFATSQTSAKAKWVYRMRQMAVRSGVTHLLGRLAAPLMRAAYGELTPLPERLPLADVAVCEPAVAQLDPILCHTEYRVLYAVAQRPV